MHAHAYMHMHAHACACIIQSCTLRICLRYSLLVGHTESECAVMNGATVGKLVLARVQSPRLVAEVKLVGKSNTKGAKVSSTGNLFTQV